MNAPQPDPEPERSESPRPTSSQPTDLTNVLAALRVHDASMPDYEAERGEIEQEERLAREELTQALPGDHLLGPLQPQTLRRRDPAPASPELPFKVTTTRHGTVYHTRYNCHFLIAPTTGPTTFHGWCNQCRDESAQTGRIPGPGATILLAGLHSYANADVTCSRA